MNAVPPTDARATGDVLAERAMRHTATILAPLTACRRRACRRNGCCGALVDDVNAAAPCAGQAGFPRIPPCLVGVDADLAGVFAAQSRLTLDVLLKRPDYDLHPARL